MNMPGKVLTIFLLLSSTFIPYGLAQDSSGDFCQRHADLWDRDGNITLEGHKKLYVENPGWWLNSGPKGWEEWPAQETRWSLEEHKDLYVDGEEWWYDSNVNRWKEWPIDQNETLECHKKLFLSGPQWWFDSEAREWKRWPQ